MIKNDQKRSKIKKELTERLVSSFAFPLKIFTDLCCDYFRISLYGVTHISFHLFSKYVAGTFLNDHHVAQNVLDIRFIITIQNSQFWSLRFTGIFVLTG